MKPFVINRNSWHYKLNKNFMNEDKYIMYKDWEPKHSNFCSYWRATMFRIVGVCLATLFATLFASLIIFPIGFAFYFDPITSFTVLGSIVGVIAVLICMVVASEMIKERNRLTVKKPESLIVQKYRAHKSKICPTIDFE